MDAPYILSKEVESRDHSPEKTENVGSILPTSMVKEPNNSVKFPLINTGIASKLHGEDKSFTNFDDTHMSSSRL